MTKTYCIDVIAKPLWMLKKTGLWSLESFNSRKTIKLGLYCVSSIAAYIITFCNIKIALDTNNTALLNWTISVLFPLSNYYSKAITLFTNRTCLKLILRDLKSSTFNNHAEKLNKYIQRVDSISNVLFRYFAAATVVFLAIFSFLPIFLEGIVMVIPPCFDTGKYDVLYKIWHMLYTCFIVYTSAALDILFMTLINFATAQLGILEEQLLSVSEEARNVHQKRGNRRSLDSITIAILRECVILHGTINIYVARLSTILSFPLFIQYLGGCFIVCSSILQLTRGGAANLFKIIGLCGYSGSVLAQMAVYHWLANEIIFKSTKIVDACYLANWYEIDIKSQKCLLLLMERAKTPLAITIRKFIIISLASLGGIIKWSYSLFALLKTSYR